PVQCAGDPPGCAEAILHPADPLRWSPAKAAFAKSLHLTPAAGATLQIRSVRMRRVDPPKPGHLLLPSKRTVDLTPPVFETARDVKKRRWPGASAASRKAESAGQPMFPPGRERRRR